MADQGTRLTCKTGEEIFTFRSSRSTLIRVIADGPWTGGDMERLYDHLRLMLDIDCFEESKPAGTTNSAKGGA